MFRSGFTPSCLVAAALALAGAAPAHALTIVPNPFVIDGTGPRTGTALVEVVTGLPDGAFLGFGEVLPTSTTLVFEVTLDPSSSSSNVFFDVRIADALAGVPTAGVGWIPGPGADIVLAIGGSADGWTSFGPNNPTPGAAFERVFVSYDTPLATDGSLRVEADLGGATGTALLVPEPATALSLGAALVALAAARRRRGRAAPSTRKPSRC